MTLRPADAPDPGQATGAGRFGSPAASLVVGVAILGAGAWLGLDPSLLDAVLTGPAVARFALAAAAGLLGLWLLLRALQLLADDDEAGPETPRRSFADVVRGVRSVFLAIAAFAAASAFVAAHPLPLVLALMIAGVDVVETAFLLLVGRRPDAPPR